MAASQNPQVDLCTVDDVVAFMGGEVNATAKDELQFLVTACSQAAATYCCRNFIQQTYAEVRNGTGNPLLVLRNSPVTSISAVSVGANSIPPGVGGGQRGYVLDDTTLYLLGGYIFERGVQNVVVNYTAGYTPITDPDSTIPYDLRQAVVEAISVVFKRRQNLGVSSKTIAGESITYILAQWPASSKAVLSYYQRAAYD